MATTVFSPKINYEIKRLVAEALYDILNDPDFGLELSARAKKRLRRASAPSRRTISFGEIKRKYY
jgi:hypothetical protein